MRPRNISPGRTGRAARILRVAAGALGARLTRRRVPLKVILQITAQCNLRCSYCYVPFHETQGQKDMSTRQVKELIDLLAGHGTRWLWIVGGEPLLRPDLPEIVAYSQQKGIFTDLSTNGLLVREEHLPLLKSLDALCISVDSSVEAHDGYRGPGSYEKLSAIIAMLVRNGVRPRLHSMLTRTTAHGLADLEELASRFGVSYNYCEILREQPHQDSLSEAEHRAFYGEYLRRTGTRSASANSRLGMKKLLAWPKADATILSRAEARGLRKSDYVECKCGDLQCFIDVDGSMYSCSGRWKKGLSLMTSGFDAAWKQLAVRECAACRCLGMTEATLLLGLSPGWIGQAVKNLMRI